MTNTDIGRDKTRLLSENTVVPGDGGFVLGCVTTRRLKAEAIK